MELPQDPGVSHGQLGVAVQLQLRAGPAASVKEISHRKKGAFKNLKLFHVKMAVLTKAFHSVMEIIKMKNLISKQNEKKWKTETVAFSVLTFPIQNSSESFPCCVKMFLF